MEKIIRDNNIPYVVYDEDFDILFVKEKTSVHEELEEKYGTKVIELHFLFADGHYRGELLEVYHAPILDQFIIVGESGPDYVDDFGDIVYKFSEHPNRLEKAMKEIGLLDYDKQYIFIEGEYEFVEVDPNFKPVARNYGSDENLERELYKSVENGDYIIKEEYQWQRTPDYSAWYVEIAMEDDEKVVFIDDSIYRKRDNRYIY